MTLNSIKDESKWNFQVFQKVRVPKRKERIRAHRIFSLRKTMQKWERRGTSIESSSINGRSTVDQSKVGFDYWRFVFVFFVFFWEAIADTFSAPKSQYIDQNQHKALPFFQKEKKTNKQKKTDNYRVFFYRVLTTIEIDHRRRFYRVLPRFHRPHPSFHWISMFQYKKKTR